MKTLDKNSTKLLKSYKKDLKKFIRNNDLDSEFYEDIEERIEEKINFLEDPSFDDIKNILAEIGTPSEIFAEELSSRGEVELKGFWGKFKQKTNSVIFLGVFKELEDKTGVSANIYRIIFLLLVFLSIFSGQGFGIAFWIFLYFFGFLILRTGIFRFFFSFLIGAGCFLLVIPSVFLLGAYFSNFHIKNIYPFMEMPILFPIGMVIGIFSLVMLGIFFMHYTFNKRTLGIKFFLTGSISFIIAITMGVSIGFNLFGKYYGKETEIINLETELKGEKTVSFPGLNVGLEISSNNTKVETPNQKETGDSSSTNGIETLNGKPLLDEIGELAYISPFFVNFTASPDNKIRLNIEKETIGNDYLRSKIKSYIKGLSLKNENGNINIEIARDTENKYPFVPIVLKVRSVELPKNVEFNTYFYGVIENFKKGNYVLENIHQKYAETIFRKCEKYFFDNDGKLNCNKDEIERIVKEKEKENSDFRN
ncbi:hypothetical protein D8B46_06005 [Candidatus Gracilibacteria bacterium]|nr:MAG: hypothetical protein D8B46_06005 [Candidatus Gracilibacteria bacterium]